MKLQSGMPLLYQQYKALLRKNLVLAKRNMSYTLIKLFSSCFFLLLLFCVEKILKASSAGEAVVDPKPLVSPPIPPCEDKFHIKTPCFDFLWSGRGSAQIKNIVTGIMVNNPGRPIPAKKVKSFRTKSQVDDWLFRNPLRCPGALHFSIVNKTVISYGIQTNFTATSKEGKKEDLTFKFFIPLQIATERKITRSLIGDPRFSWDVGFKKFAHPAEANSIDLTESLPLFFFAISMFGFVFQMSSLVVEKELKLRQAMSMMGLYDTAYWFSWLTWEGIITLLSSLLTVLFGMMFQLDFFIRNSFAVAFLLFFVFQLNMIGLAFMLSAFINKSSSATRVGFSIFLIGTLTQIATASGMIYTEVFPKKYRILWSFFPPNLLAEALTLLSEASEPDTDGISWSRRAECSPNNNGCVLTINDIYIWLASTFFLWFVLAIYLDNILPNAAGVRKPLFYFLNPGYWVGKDGNKVKEGNIFSLFGSVPLPENITPDDEDVLEEENIVKQEAGEEKVDENVAVQIHGLIKTFPGTKKIGCCKWKETPPYHAVKGLWVNLAKNQLFCLLGPNGAGKTTTINCLIGITPVTDGDAFVHGNSIRSSIGMSNIRRIIGVCPQFDVLWDALSGEEHLYLFASIKGLQPASIGTISSKLLEDVKLSEASHMRSSSYSGGMKRRLSVAIALIGDPKLVILDEPTSGMDPITRRHVWDIIEEAKRGRAIVLTTHSMEEADILSDRIGIMAKGRLRCIGTSIRLKSRFGTGFIANVSFTRSIDGETPSNREAVATTRHEAVKKFFKHHLNIEPEEENEAFLTFVIPRDREDLLTNFFRKLQDSISEFGIADIQLGLATLEEVFLNIAKKAELESAAEERRLVTLTLTSGLSLQIPVGAQFVKIPGTESAENPKGVMVEVYWHQDDSGSLRIYDHSPVIPIPSHIQDSDATSNIFLARTGPIHGVVTDLSFLEKKD